MTVVNIQPTRRLIILSETWPSTAYDLGNHLKQVLDDSVEVVRLWTGDPHHAPVGESQVTRSPLGPPGLLYVALDHVFYKMFAGLSFALSTDSPELTIIISPHGFRAQPGWSGRYEPGPAFRFARKLSERDLEVTNLPDVWDLRGETRASLEAAVKALSVGCLPPNLSVSPNGARGLVREKGQPHSGCLLEYQSDAVTHPPAQRAPVLPGGFAIDGSVKRVARELLEDSSYNQSTLPDPYGDGLEDFLTFAEAPQEPWRSSRGRIWQYLWEERTDLQERFALPDSREWSAYDRWCKTRYKTEDCGRIFAGFGSRYGEKFAHISASEEDSPKGVNVVGYLSKLSSQGIVSRTLLEALSKSGVGVRAIDYGRSPSPSLSQLPLEHAGSTFNTNLISIGGDTFYNEFFLAPEIFKGRRNVGYWFWELEKVPERIIRSSTLVEEVWAPTDFIARAFAGVLECPVKVIPFPIPNPAEPSGAPPLERFGNRPIFLTIFDFLSTESRKNPQGAIQAFMEAFDESPDGPLLLVKSINGDKVPERFSRLRSRAEDRGDICFTDARWTAGQVSSALRDAVCLVSLHRSEGLGLTPLEALMCGTPSISTGYGGITDYSDLAPDSSNAPMRFVGFDMVEVRDGEGLYDEDGVWAQPRISEAAKLMASLVNGAWDPASREGMKRVHQRSRLAARSLASEVDRLVAN